MAVLQKIRNRAGILIIVFVGVALFLFIVDPSTFRGLFNKMPTSIAEIDGEEIPLDVYNARLDQHEEFMKITRQQSSLDAETMEQLRKQTWEELFQEYLLINDLEELGVSVSEPEMEDLLWGNNIHPIIQQNFKNPNTGMLDTTFIMQYFTQTDQDPSGRQAYIAQYIKQLIKRDRAQMKYRNLLKKGYYTPKAIAQMEYADANTTVQFAYVYKKLKEVPDEEVQVEESDISSYYDDHKYMFINEKTTRSIEYVGFNIVPSKEDSTQIKEEILEFKRRMSQMDDMADFVEINSDKPYRGKTYLPEEVPGGFGDSLFIEMPENFVSDVYISEGGYEVFKLEEFVETPDSVHASHILIRPDSVTSLEQAQNIADSLKAEIDAGADFAQLAMTHSDDPGSAQKGGDLSWFAEGTMVKSFNDACFYEGNEGDILTVNSQFGVHIIKILKQSPKKTKAKLAILHKEIFYSNDTYQEIFAAASEFANENNTADAFNKAVQEKNIPKRLASNIKENDSKITGLDYARSIIRWMFKAEKDAISSVFEANDKFVIAHLTKIKEEGQAPLEQVKDQIEPIVLQKKKADKLMEEFKSAADAQTDLPAIAQALNAQMDTAKNIHFSSFSVPRVGIEPKLISTAANTAPGTVTDPVEGNNGVYLIKVLKKQEAEQQASYASMQLQRMNTIGQRVEYQMLQAQKKKAEVEDNRSVFF